MNGNDTGARQASPEQVQAAQRVWESSGAAGYDEEASIAAVADAVVAAGQVPDTGDLTIHLMKRHEVEAERDALRAEVERLHGRLADSERTITELAERVARRQARADALAETLDRVRALADRSSWRPLGNEVVVRLDNLRAILGDAPTPKGRDGR